MTIKNSPNKPNKTQLPSHQTVNTDDKQHAAVTNIKKNAAYEDIIKLVKEKRKKGKGREQRGYECD